ncbi:MAG: thioredoxin domain-containing protein [Patescibacteria group bacterium]|jgi:protein-disulfide isomerase
MKDTKKNIKTVKVKPIRRVTKNKKKNYFEVIFIIGSILLFLILILALYWLKSSLYEAKDQVAENFVKDYEANLILDTDDPLVGLKNSESQEPLTQPSDTGLDPFLGPDDAKVKIFIFSDFACPFCLEQENIIKKVYDNFKEDVRIIWKDYPEWYSLGSFSYQAAKAGRCAQEQGKFWDYNSLLYQSEADFAELKEGLFLNLAEKLKLNIDNFKKCLASDKADQLILQNISEAEDLGIVGVPYIYINDLDVLGNITEEELSQFIETEINLD